MKRIKVKLIERAPICVECKAPLKFRHIIENKDGKYIPIYECLKCYNVYEEIEK